MKFQSTINNFLSTCSGKIMNVFYMLYDIVEKIPEENQAEAIMYICENYSSIESDLSQEITKDYYTEAQLHRIAEKFAKKNLDLEIDTIAQVASKSNLSPIDFYSFLWDKLKKDYKTKRERALMLHRITTHELIPYKSVGTGITMSNEEYRNTIDDIGTDLLNETEYILALDYDQRTQCASLLVSKLLQLEDFSKQSVYMSVILRIIERNIKDSIKSMID